MLNVVSLFHSLSSKDSSLKPDRITLRFDGGSRGNPGPAAIGIVLEADDGTPVFSVGRFIGHATNNVAEYTALVQGLAEALKLGVRNLRVLGDSELVIKQMLGEYKVKNETLKPLFEKAQTHLRKFEHAEIGHNKRGHNTLADTLANLAMDKKGEVTEVDIAAGGVSSGDEAGDDETAESVRLECLRCACVIRIEKPGEIPAVPKAFKCRCGTPMRPI